MEKLTEKEQEIISDLLSLDKAKSLMETYDVDYDEAEEIITKARTILKLEDE